MSPASYQTAPPRVDVSATFVQRSACRLAVVPSRRLLHPRAGNGTRTRDPNLGKVVLYQLSYSREPLLPGHASNLADLAHNCQRRVRLRSGGEGDRTPDLVNAIHALSQLSYAPAILTGCRHPAFGTRQP